MEKEEKIHSRNKIIFSIISFSVCTLTLFAMAFIWSASTHNDLSSVPFILHRTSRDFGALSYPINEFHDECKKYYKNWEIKEWTDTGIDHFVKTEYPQYYSRFSEMVPIIRRVDAVRYLWMHYYGGVYLDMDVECIRPLDDFVRALPRGSTAWIEGYPEPFVLMSTSGNNFWLFSFELILRDWKKYNVRSTGGPQGLDRMARAYVNAFGVDAVRKFSISDPSVANGLHPKGDVVPGEETWRWIHGPKEFAPSQSPVHHKIGFFSGHWFDPTACLSSIGKCRNTHCHTRVDHEGIQKAFGVHHCMESWKGEAHSAREQKRLMKNLG